MQLIDELLMILNARQGSLSMYESACLKAAISFLDQEDKGSIWGGDKNWRVRLTSEEAHALPGSYWEFCNGQVSTKD